MKIRSYKTSLVALGILAFAGALKAGWIDQASVTEALALATAVGFFLTKDFNASHSKDAKDDKPKDPQL